MPVFIGVMGEKAFLLESVRTAFADDRFNICCLHKLPCYDHVNTFAEWARGLHCKRKEEVSEELWSRLKYYVVNYVLCPDATDEFEVEAYVREVWPDKCTQASKVVARIGKFSLVVNNG